MHLFGFIEQITGQKVKVERRLQLVIMGAPGWVILWVVFPRKNGMKLRMPVYFDANAYERDVREPIRTCKMVIASRP